MSTRAQIAIQIGPAEWAHVYVHFDGYPAHMLPALARWKLEDILTAREIRQVTAEALDCFSPPCDPRILPRPTREFAISTCGSGANGWQPNRRSMRPECNQKALILLGFTYTIRPTRAMVITRIRCNSPKDDTP